MPFCYVTMTAFACCGSIVMVLLTNHQLQVRQDPRRGFDQAETLGWEASVVSFVFASESTIQNNLGIHSTQTSFGVQSASYQTLLAHYLFRNLNISENYGNFWHLGICLNLDRNHTRICYLNSNISKWTVYTWTTIQLILTHPLYFIDVNFNQIDNVQPAW